MAVAGTLWLAQLMTDGDRHFVRRALLVIAMFGAEVIGLIRFVKWVWNA